MKHYVYEITNNINGRKYIGKRSCSCPIEKDLYFGSGLAIKEALKKYGTSNFTKKILKVFNTSEEAFKYEEYLIDKLHCVDDVGYYNIAKGGLGGVAPFANKTELEKWDIYNRMRNNLKGKMAGNKNPMYGKIGKLNPLYGKPLSAEHKEKVRNALKGKPFTKAHRENISKSRIGMKLSEEHKKNIGLGLKGRKMTDKCKKATREASIKPIILINDLSVYGSITEAMNAYNVCRQSIGKVCRGKRKSAGIVNGERAKWMYLKDYNYCIENSIDFDLFKNEKYHK